LTIISAESGLRSRILVVLKEVLVFILIIVLLLFLFPLLWGFAEGFLVNMAALLLLIHYCSIRLSHTLIILLYLDHTRPIRLEISHPRFREEEILARCFLILGYMGEDTRSKLWAVIMIYCLLIEEMGSVSALRENINSSSLVFISANPNSQRHLVFRRG